MLSKKTSVGTFTIEMFQPSWSTKYAEIVVPDRHSVPLHDLEAAEKSEGSFALTAMQKPMHNNTR